MSALTPAEPLSTRDSATRVTPSRLAASVTLISESHSRRTSPGCGGLCISVMVVSSSVIVLIIDEHGVLAFKCKRERAEECLDDRAGHLHHGDAIRAGRPAAADPTAESCRTQVATTWNHSIRGDNDKKCHLMSRRNRCAGGRVGHGTDSSAGRYRRRTRPPGGHRHRREALENVQNVPMSMTTFSSASLQQQAITQFVDYATKVPNLAFAPTGDGVGTARTLSIQDISGDNVTGFSIDDVPLPDSIDPRVIDIERIEVLRGRRGLCMARARRVARCASSRRRPSCRVSPPPGTRAYSIRSAPAGRTPQAMASSTSP